MARPKAPVRPGVSTQRVSGNRLPAIAASAQVFRQNQRPDLTHDRRVIARQWQRDVYRHVNICGEARYAATLFSSIAGRAEIGISEPQALAKKAVWVDPSAAPEEVAALAELAPTVRERSRLIRDYMLHRVIAGECYLIARNRLPTDPEYTLRRGEPVWEIVAVTELRKMGDGRWQVRHENDNYIDLDPADPIIRMWVPDPENRMEAWSPFRALLPTLNEIEWLTKHIFAQVRSRLMSAGVWFLPENLTFPAPPPDAVEGGAEAIAALNEAEQFMLSLSIASMKMLDADEPAFPTTVMADPAALAMIDQQRLIKFWSEIDDKAMVLRSDAVRRFALGMDMPPEQILGSSGIAVTGAGGSAGSVNHWGVWANEEQTISAHVEPALDDFTAILTNAFLRNAVDNTPYVIGYDTASLRLRQDRSKESIELFDRGALKASVMLRENGFDPENDMMDEAEFRKWMLTQIAKGSATPEMVAAANELLGIRLPVPPTWPQQAPQAPAQEVAPGVPGPALPRNLDDHPYEGPPREDHDHNEAPFSALHASCEALVLRALEKAGNRLLNDGKRGRDKDRSTPPHMAHLVASVVPQLEASEFDFGLAATVFGDRPAMERALIERRLAAFCARLYAEGAPYTREGLIDALEGL